MRLEHQNNTHPRLLRKQALGDDIGNKGRVRKQRETPKGSRFVGATHLDEEQKTRLSQALEKKQIGDEIGRQIFIGALEYQLSAFGQQLKRRVEPKQKPRRRNPALEETLQGIVEKARLLSGLLRDLPDVSKEGLIKTLAAQDQLGRDYDEQYLCELGCEIHRLERACTAAAAENEPEEPTEDPAPSRDFVAKLAGIFSECFELEPTADENAPFSTSLAILDEVIGVVIGHDPDFLADVLSSERG
ncbi:MAG: hypothetical protein U9Q81_13930 [Pseudomonadota bacterium]|nr:hypothetical protein [Pseudomonadota bacterium]